MPPARYVVIGAGAIGGTIAGRLALGGVPVVAVARGEHARTMRADGLLFRTPEADHRVPLTVWESPTDAGELGAGDVLVLATKTPQAADALADWAGVPVAGGGTAGERLPVLVALNGVTGEDIALRYFRRVYGVCVWAPCRFTSPGVVEAFMTPQSGIFHTGRFPAVLTDDEDRALLDRLKTDWEGAGLLVPLPADVMPWKYRKLISNIGNAFDALTGPAGRQSDLPHRAREEARAVLAAAGIEVTPDADERAARESGPQMGQIAGTSNASSSWQSLERGTGSIETDYLNGEIARIAHLHGQSAPINEKVAALAARAAREGWGAGSMTVADLAALLG